MNALAWAQELGRLPSPTSHPTVRTMQESAHRIKGRPKLRKELASLQLLQKMVSTLAQESTSLLDIQYSQAVGVSPRMSTPRMLI